MPRLVTRGWSRLDGWALYWETLWALTAFEGGILGQGVSLVSSSVSLPRLRVYFHHKTLLYENLNQNYNILCSEHLIVYSCFIKNPSTWSWLTTHHFIMGVLQPAHTWFMGSHKLSSFDYLWVGWYLTSPMVMYIRIVYEPPMDRLERYRVEDVH
jgi:membrane-bound acyltransferase YfiQ involved in biofilm formation